MDLFDDGNSFEKYMRQKCAESFSLFTAGLELTPECNMDCRFCYVHQNKMNKMEPGTLLSGDEWLDIIEQAFKMGLYSVLITGGEPLLHPDFKKIYAGIAEKGIVITLNSNGILLDEDWIRFFKEHGLRRINISVYGSDDETYKRLCGYPGGFTRVMKTLELLRKHDLPFRIHCSVVPQNVEQVEKISDLAKNLNVPVKFATYMFPATRRGIDKDHQYRMSPEAAAQAAIACHFITNPTADREASARYTLSKLINPQRFNNNNAGFICYAGKSDCWISWNGEMRPCGLFSMPGLTYKLSENPVAECWSRLVKDSHSMHCRSEECTHCEIRDLCQCCPAANYAETGRLDGTPSYMCAMNHERVRIIKETVNAFDEKHRSQENKRQDKADPKVSVIVPVFNSKSYLKACIQSILKQSMQDFEVILVDDGSSDGSEKICDMFGLLDKRIKVIHQKNKGVSAARNRGIRVSRAPYIMFCDSDDIAEPDWVRSFYNKMMIDDSAFIMSSVWVGRQENPRSVLVGFDEDSRDNSKAEDAVNYATFAYVWNKIYKKELLVREKLEFDESISYGEDYAFNSSYLKYCKKLLLIHEPVYIHLNNAGGLASQGLAKRGKTFSDIDISQYGYFSNKKKP